MRNDFTSPSHAIAVGRGATGTGVVRGSVVAFVTRAAAAAPRATRAAGRRLRGGDRGCAAPRECTPARDARPPRRDGADARTPRARAAWPASYFARAPSLP